MLAYAASFAVPRSWKRLFSTGKKSPEQDLATAHRQSGTVITSQSGAVVQASQSPNAVPGLSIDVGNNGTTQPLVTSNAAIDRGLLPADFSTYAVPTIEMQPQPKALTKNTTSRTVILEHQEHGLKSKAGSLKNVNVTEHSQPVDEKEVVRSLLPELIGDRLTVLGLRSYTQEQAGALRRLCTEFSEIASEVVAKISDNMQSTSEPVSTSLNDQLVIISTVVENIEMARKAFNKSQQQLSTLEWKMHKVEKQVYSGPLGIQIPDIDTSEIGENPSDLSSIPLPSLSDDQKLAIEPVQLSVPLEEENSDTIADTDAHIESGRAKRITDLATSSPAMPRQVMDGYTHTSLTRTSKHICLPASIVNDPESQSNISPGQGLRYPTTKQAMKRLGQDASELNPHLSFIGAQFLQIREVGFSTATYPYGLELIRPQSAQMSSRGVLEVCQQLPHRVPLTFFNDRSQQDPHQSPIKTKLLRDVLDIYEVILFGLPMSTRSSLFQSQDACKVAAAKASWVDDWVSQQDAFPHDAVITTFSLQRNEPRPQTRRPTTTILPTTEGSMSIRPERLDPKDPAELPDNHTERPNLNINHFVHHDETLDEPLTSTVVDGSVNSNAREIDIRPSNFPLGTSNSLS